MKIIPIRDLSDKALDPYARLTEAQLLNRDDPENAMFIAESPLVIERALEAGCVCLSILAEDKHIGNFVQEIAEKFSLDVPVYTAEFSVLTQLTGFKLTRGMLALMKRPRLLSMEEVTEGANRIAVLEDVVNPTNLGAIFRSAAALGVDGVLISAASSDPLYRRAIRVSMGNVFKVPWAFFSGETADAIYFLGQKGFHTAALALKENSVPIDEPRLCGMEKLALVLGTEGEGLKDETIAACDDTVIIPMTRGVDSLNVAAASAVAFFATQRR